MMHKSWLKTGGVNLFQEIKAKCSEAEKSGKKLIRLSIGQPKGSALLSARGAAAKAVRSNEESMHEYQDNFSLGVPHFASRFIKAHVKRDLSQEEVDYLPIPGIKAMLGLVILACGAEEHYVWTATMTNPGYPTPKVWCDYLQVENTALPLNPKNEFRFDVDDLEKMGYPNLLMLNYPHNPSGQIVTREWWQEICNYCENNGVRLFNDAAYDAISFTEKHCSLADVAPDYPELSWMEAYSASKLIGNGTGWRIGAMVGSIDFISDMKTIKSNTDSGFVAPMAAGVIEAVENDWESIQKNVQTYKNRTDLLVPVLQGAGLQLAVIPKATFYTLWKCPNRAFGQEITSARDFNFLMIEKTGIAGVHFDPYMRYTVCTPIGEVIDEIERAFKAAEVSY